MENLNFIKKINGVFILCPVPPWLTIFINHGDTMARSYTGDLHS
jgi:hypothetical protein